MDSEPKTLSDVAAGMLKRIAEAKANGPTPEEQEKARQAQDARLANERRGQLASAWGQLIGKVGKRYESCTLANYDANGELQQKAYLDVAAYASNIKAEIANGAGMVLFGPPGTGKDHLAVAVMRRAIAEGVKCEAIDGQMLFQAARDIIGTNQNEKSLLKPYLVSGLLLISDPLPPIETAGPKEYQLTLLWRIIDQRYREKRPTIVTVNVKDRAELDRRLAPNIIDRLIDGSLVVPCKWQSYRKRQQEPSRRQEGH